MNIKMMITMKIALALALGATAACTKGEASLDSNKNNRTENKTAVNTAPATAEPTKPVEPAEKPGSMTAAATLDLSTPTAAYKTAYAARKNKDLPTLKRTMSKDALEFMSILVEPGETIDDALLQMTATPQAATDESRNEKITNDTATLEYPDEKGSWKTMYLVKENGEWKMTMPKADTPGANVKNKSK